MSTATVNQFRRNGLPTARADELAISLGHHPSELWPTWMEDADAEDRCPWCFEWRFGGAYCNARERDLNKAQRARDRGRQVQWWRRIDRYRDSVVIPVENAVSPTPDNRVTNQLEEVS